MSDVKLAANEYIKADSNLLRGTIEHTDQVDGLLTKHGISEQPIVMPMTGYPNGCARPYAAEIGLVGQGPDRYGRYLGTAFDGTQLSKMVGENINQGEIMVELEDRFEHFAANRQSGQHFGDFLIRSGGVKAVINSARHFHE